jgi:hypothetical protein
MNQEEIDDVVSLAELNQTDGIEKYSKGIFYQTLAKSSKNLKNTQIVRKAIEIEFYARQKCMNAANVLQTLYWEQESAIEALIPSNITTLNIDEKVDVAQIVENEIKLNLAIRNASIKYKACLAVYKRYVGYEFKNN